MCYNWLTYNITNKMRKETAKPMNGELLIKRRVILSAPKINLMANTQKDDLPRDSVLDAQDTIFKLGEGIEGLSEGRVVLPKRIFTPDFVSMSDNPLSFHQVGNALMKFSDKEMKKGFKEVAIDLYYVCSQFDLSLTSDEVDEKFEERYNKAVELSNFLLEDAKKA